MNCNQRKLTGVSKCIILCRITLQVFSNSSAIAKHKLTHSDERKHVCHVCKKAFKRQDHLNGHKLTHASKKPHGCRICEKSYSDARSLRRHYENAHPDEYELWRAAEEAETQLSAVVVAAAAAASGSASGSASGPAAPVVGGSSNNNNLAQHLVADKVTNGRNSPWFSSAAGSVNSATSGGDAGGGGGGSSGRVSPVISEQLKAVLMALPLEAPRVVPCAFCHRRFKNQSALNGHMRLHGGYGLIHATPVSSTSVSSASGSCAKTSKPLQGLSIPPRLSLPGSNTMSRLKKQPSHGQQLSVGLGSQSTNEPFRPLRDLPDSKSEGSSSSLFDWPCGPVSTLPVITTEALCVSSTAASITTSLSVRPWPAHSGQQSQQQSSSNHYSVVRQGIPRPHSELHFNEATGGHSPYRGLGGDTGGTSFRKRPSSTTFGGSSPLTQQHQFRSGPQDSMWFSPQHPPSHQPSLRTIRNDPTSSVDPIFNNLRLFDTVPNAASFRHQGSRYISRLAPPPPPSHTFSQLSGGEDYSGSKLESLAMFGTTASSEQPSHHQQSGFFQSGSYPNLHGISSGSAVDRPAAQPHYSPITPASGGFGGNSNSASSAFTFPPTDALLASTSTPSPPPISQQGVQQQHHQQQQFLCPCPPSRSNTFVDSNKWLSHEPHSVEPMLSSPLMGQFSSPPPPPPAQQSMNPTPSYQQHHENVKQQPPRLYTPVQTQQQTQENVEDTSRGSDFYQQQQLHSMYDHRPKPICSNTGYDSSLMRHPMTPQHTTTGIQPRAYSYCTNSTQAAYSVPVMPNRKRVFFSDDSDPLLLTGEDPGPINRLLPPPQQTIQQTQPMSNQLSPQHQMQPSQCFELSCVPTHKYAQQQQNGGSKKEDEGSSTEGIFRNPPPLTQQSTLTNQSLSSQIHLPSLSSVTAAQSPTSPPGVSGATLKKVKKKPEPIVIPSFTHRINPSRLRSPRLSTANSVAVSNSELNALLPLKGGQSMSGGLSLNGMLESLPYTPPPMLSPNRRGSGLFSSMIARSRRPPRTATAASAASLSRLRTSRGSIPSGLSRVDNSGPMVMSSGMNLIGNFSGDANAAASNANSGGAGDTDRQIEKSFLALARRSGISPGASPKSAPAFTKNAAYFSSETSLNSMRGRGDDIAPPTVAMRTTMLGGDEVECPRPPSKPLFFADEDDDELASMLDTEAAVAVEDSHQIPDVVIPESSEADTLHGDEAATIPAPNRSNFPPIPHGTDTPSSPSCHCCADVSPAIPQVEEMDYDEDVDSDDSIVEDIGVPSNFEPKINIGAEYQADVPEFAEGCVRDLYREENRFYESLLWDPRNIDDNDPKTEESLANLMNLARSPVVRNCGLNMEYTFHLLCKFQGDFEMTLRTLLHESFTIFDRVYSETEYWTTEEIEKFQNSLRRPYKDFHHVSAELRACGMNKSVKACVEFYYVWKRMNTPHEVNRYRGRVHCKSVPTRSDRQTAEDPPPLNQQASDLYGLPNLDNNSLDLDMPPTPDLGVDDNNSSSTSYNLRRKHNDLPPAINREFDDHELKSSSAGNESSAIATVVGSMEGGFLCRQCGRSFAKVKSRNAHMKSHATSAHSKHPGQ
nr:zinc finger protein 541 [Hymenolepis microstoma]